MCIEIDDSAASIAERRAVREHWQRVSRIERDVLAIVRAGYLPSEHPDPAMRRIAAAVLDDPASNRGLAVCGVLIEDDPVRGCWLVLIETDGGNNTRALVVSYPT